MNDAERLRLTRLFVGAVQLELQLRGRTSEKEGAVVTIPVEPRAFANAVAKTAHVSQVAARYRLYPSSSGPRCPDFQLGMAAVQASGLISRLNPSFQRFAVSLTDSQVAELEKNALFVDARTLAAEYLNITLGTRNESSSDADSAMA